MSRMSAADILEQLPQLTSQERLRIYQRIAEMENMGDLVPDAEFRTAIEVGLRSLETEPVVPLDDVRLKIAQWAGRSS